MQGELHLFRGDKHLFVRPWNGKQIEAQTQWPFQFNAIGIVAEWFGIDGRGGGLQRKVNENSSLT